jgi:hypothetical protein
MMPLQLFLFINGVCSALFMVWSLTRVPSFFTRVERFEVVVAAIGLWWAMALLIRLLFWLVST